MNNNLFTDDLEYHYVVSCRDGKWDIAPDVESSVMPDGTIYDPSRLQFPSAGNGIYTPFDGTIQCSNCGKDFKEDSEKASFESRYAFCSYLCHGIFVGVF